MCGLFLYFMFCTIVYLTILISTLITTEHLHSGQFPLVFPVIIFFSDCVLHKLSKECYEAFFFEFVVCLHICLLFAVSLGLAWVSLSRPIFCCCFSKYLFIYLAALGLSCGLWDLHCNMQHAGSFSCGTWDLVP